MQRGNLAVGALVVLMLGAAIGMLLFRWTPFEQPAPDGPPPAPGARPTQVTRQRVIQGGTYTLASLDRLWVDDTGLTLWKRAEGNRDQKAQDAIADLYENFFVQPGTRVQVIATFGEATNLKHLEVVSGQHAGRRGWTDTYSDAQYIP